jgi:hypothetical protein
MKNLILFTILGLAIISCNNDIAVKPLENSSTDSTISFNFKATPDNDYYRANSQGIYKADIELYLRPFQELAPNTTVFLKYQTDNFGVLIIKKDTLYPDDQIRLLLSDFNNFRKNGHFFTNNIGKQNLNFEIEIGKTKKATKATFETK